MKYNILLFLMIISFVELNAQKVNAKSSAKNLIGNWTANVDQITTKKKGKYTTENVLCKVCPRVIFTFERNLQNATVIKANGNRENYIWEIKGNIITFGNIDAVFNLNTFFITGYKYKFKLSTKKGYGELELFKENIKSPIILRKNATAANSRL